MASTKTPCYCYVDEDVNIPEGLKAAIRTYYRNLPKKERRELNKKLAFLLSERFFVKESAVIKVLSRILCDGNPVNDENMSIAIAAALKMQIRQRTELLEALSV